MTIRRTSVLFLLAAMCLAETGWQTATTLPGVDLASLTPADRAIALAVLRTEHCTCGCDMMIAECRMKDASCAYSRRLSGFVVQEASLGKSAAAVREDLSKFAKEPPPMLEAPVKIATDGDPVKGAPKGAVTVVEFSDFQCPYCAAAVLEVNRVLRQFPADVKVVFKQFPLESHSQAELAAEASLAAQAQGKFWELHDKMYANFQRLSRARILVWAGEVGLNVDRFRSDLDSHKFAGRVQAEKMAGEDAGVEGTPQFFINGKKLNASFDLTTVAPLILQELKH